MGSSVSASRIARKAIRLYLISSFEILGKNGHIMGKKSSRNDCWYDGGSLKMFPLHECLPCPLKSVSARGAQEPPRAT